MTSRNSRPDLWLLILSLYLTSVTSISINFEYASPKTFWVDQSCIQKGFTPVTAQESLDMATRGARRLLNLDDDYQDWLFELLFKVHRDFRLLDGIETETWNVVQVEGWIGAMTYETNRVNADVLIYCDNDERWKPVPDDMVSIAHGMKPNSQRTLGLDAEYEDAINGMRRSTSNQGCKAPEALGVTYSAYGPTNSEAEPEYTESQRQTITICDLGLASAIKRFADIPLPVWEFQEMSPLELIPTFILLHQLLVLTPYRIARGAGTYTADDDSWVGMIAMTAGQLAYLPAPYAWNAVLAYVADLGWGLKHDLTWAQYSQGRDIFVFSEELQNIPFAQGGPLTLPTWLCLPGNY